MASQINIEYARMWPREVLYQDRETLRSDPEFKILGKTGVYVLYREDVPYYIGRGKNLRSRLWVHANVPRARNYNFWTHFSVFVPNDPERHKEIEAVLIAAMPTTRNNAQPDMINVPFPKKATELLRVRHSSKQPAPIVYVLIPSRKANPSRKAK
ncbi:MAG: GIY-YIG nuclease family protein [Acidobacteriia bacterium]|nr:GIY-YIG nuclease family protein [Terriglobia bacterium]